MSEGLLIKCHCTNHFFVNTPEYFQCKECGYAPYKKGKEMKPFKTQAEIYQHLLDGGKIVSRNIFLRYLHLIDGVLSKEDGKPSRRWAFGDPNDWHPYEEPKEKKKIKVYGYVNIADGGTFTDKSETYAEDRDFVYRVPKLDVEHEYEY